MAANASVRQHAANHFDRAAAHYRVLNPDAIEIPTETTDDAQAHVKVPGTDDEYLAPDSYLKLSTWQSEGHIEILDQYFELENDNGPTLSGPVEPVKHTVTVEEAEEAGDKVTGETEIRLLNPSGDDIQEFDLGTYVCQRCGTETFVPVMNGNLQDPHQCEGCDRKGPFKHKGSEHLPDGATPAAYLDPDWHIATGCNPEGYDELWDDVKDWIETNWVTAEDHRYAGLTAYAITTWLRPNLDFVPHLMVTGRYESGKTQLLNTLARISYRGMVPVGFTAPALFRGIDTYDYTIYLSEYHDLDDDQEDMVNQVIKGSQKRGETIMRTEKNSHDGFTPRNFNIFTHFAIGTQFDTKDDIESRCIKIVSKPVNKEIDVPMWFDDDRADQLRNRLLYARFRLLESDAYRDAEDRALDYLLDRGIKNRLAEKLLSLVAVADLWDARDEIEPFVDAMERQHRQATAETDDALVVEAIRDLALEKVQSEDDFGQPDAFDDIQIPISEVTERFKDMTGRENITSGYIGQIRKRLDLDKSRGNTGTRIDDDNLTDKLEKLCRDNNLEWWPDTDTGRDSEQVKPMMLRLVRDEYDDRGGWVPRSALEGKAASRNVKMETARNALELLEQEGEIIRVTDDPVQYRPN